MTPLLVTAILPFYTDDPAPGVLRSAASARRLQCEWVEPDTLRERSPGAIMPARPRGDYIDRSALVCAQDALRPGLRSDGDEAVLGALTELTDELASATRAGRPDLQDRTWLVEVSHPSAQVTAKIAFAQKHALVAQGLSASDRVPVLGVGDVRVLTRMAPDEAWPAACTRWSATGTLRPTDALLAVVLLDPRETVLHAGVCADGRWAWVR